jgi:hypothetical protein
MREIKDDAYTYRGNRGIGRLTKHIAIWTVCGKGTGRITVSAAAKAMIGIEAA